LTTIKYLSDIKYYNLEFKVLATRVDNISDEKSLEVDIGGLKEEIKHVIFLKRSENIMAAMQFSWHIQAKNKATHNYIIGEYS
jgi:hypothetical protein